MLHKIKMAFDEKIERSRDLRIANKIGRSGLDDFTRYLHSPWRISWSNFLAGVFRGLGFVIGATVILTVAVYILVQVLGNLPWVGEYFARIGEFVQSVQEISGNLQDFGR